MIESILIAIRRPYRRADHRRIDIRSGPQGHGPAQNRIGPPIEQPIYDFIKLWSKDQVIANNSQVMYVYAYIARRWRVW
jgi:hypothetical protein